MENKGECVERPHAAGPGAKVKSGNVPDIVDELCRMEGTWPGYIAWRMKNAKQKKHD